jgi:hypothetical protein
MTRRIRNYPNEAAALAQHAAISVALGYPRKGSHVGGGRHVTIPDVPTDENSAGWSVEACRLIDAPGPTVGIDVTHPATDALHGQVVSVPGRGNVTISVRPTVERGAQHKDRPSRVAR